MLHEKIYIYVIYRYCYEIYITKRQHCYAKWSFANILFSKCIINYADKTILNEAATEIEVQKEEKTVSTSLLNRIF